MPRIALSTSLRTFVGTLVLLVPAAALAVDNNNMGTPQNDCERIATGDYYANIDSCRRNLSGDAQATAQCEIDAAYDYQDSLAQCKKQATRNGSAGMVGTLGGVLETSPGKAGKPNMSVKKGGLLARF